MATHLEYQNYLQLMEPGYIFKPQRRVNDKQWLCKDQARPALVNEKKAWEKVSYAFVLNSDWQIVQV